MHAASWDTGVEVYALKVWTLDDGWEVVSVYADRHSALEAMLVEITELVAQVEADPWTAESVLDPGYRERAEELAAELGGMDSDGDFYVDLQDRIGFGAIWTTEGWSLLAQPGTEGVAK